MYQSNFETERGYGTVFATELGICKINLPSEPGDGIGAEAGQHPSSPLTEQVAKMLRLYFMGQQQPFESVPVDLTGLPPFRMRILTLIRTIPYGETRSYKDVSLLAGLPHAARAVGGAMASNPVPIIIPCHRVVAANGLLTGYTAPGGLKLKKNILRAEGVEFKGEQVARKC
ncbi:methylated-DNA--[protein]-cysteine S-methyltransferase [Pelotalea chapellei]|uniref:Methylated-DNA--[protein]-cysteine S-methyltransferase n=1 Tax=Pelotalea chapellei TaxID=44671 RepID=A0ABS5U746_9BACT|nr:methylated-DNA--[protein]-cysteine S-methyltransferase [Pelotalea chapellei]MBT1071490.1 methylated-DNA--[protein]-cysteine S-methyltransferase [Pelotalea chapellei]